MSNLRSFTLAAGTQAQPVELTTRQMAALLAVANDATVQKNVSGWVTPASGTITSGDRYLLQSACPALNVVATTVADSYSVYLEGGNTLDEGTSAYFVAQGIASSMLQMEIADSAISVTDGQMTLAKALGRVSLTREGDGRWKLACAAAQENDSWQMTLTVDVWPSYDSSTKRSIAVNVSARGLTALAVTGADAVNEGESTTYVAALSTASGAPSTKTGANATWACDSGANIDPASGRYTAPVGGTGYDTVRATIYMYGLELRAAKNVTVWTTVLNATDMNPALFAIVKSVLGHGSEVTSYSNYDLGQVSEANVNLIIPAAVASGTINDPIDLTELQFFTRLVTMGYVTANDGRFYIDNIVFPPSCKTIQLRSNNGRGRAVYNVYGKFDTSHCTRATLQGSSGATNALSEWIIDSSGIADLSGIAFVGTQGSGSRISIYGTTVFPNALIRRLEPLPLSINSGYYGIGTYASISTPAFWFYNDEVLEGGIDKLGLRFSNVAVHTEATKALITSSMDRVFVEMQNLTTLVDADGNEFRYGTEAGFVNFDFLNSGRVKFFGCTELALTLIPEAHTYALTSIPEYSFVGCTALALTGVPTSVRSIGQYAFYGCTGLGNWTWPANLTSIGNYAFYGCTGLDFASFPNGLTELRDRAFASCPSLLSLTSIGNVTGFTKFYANALPVENGAMTKIELHIKNTASIDGDWGLMVSARKAVVAVTIEMHGVISNPNINASMNAAGDAPYCFDLYDVRGVTSWGQSLNYNDGSKDTSSIFVLPNTNYVVTCGFSGSQRKTEMMGNSTLYVPDALVASYRAATNWNLAKAIRAHSEYISTDKALILAGNAPDYDTDYVAP